MHPFPVALAFPNYLSHWNTFAELHCNPENILAGTLTVGSDIGSADTKEIYFWIAKAVVGG